MGCFPIFAKKAKMNALRIFQLAGIMLPQLLISCNGQPKPNNQNQQITRTDTKQIVGGGCDGCEIMYVGMPKIILPEDNITVS